MELPYNDPRQLLSEDAIRRVKRAYLKLERMRQYALIKDGAPSRKAEIKGACRVVQALSREYAAVRIDDPRKLLLLSSAEDDEIQGLVNALKLTREEKRLMSIEWNWARTENQAHATIAPPPREIELNPDIDLLADKDAVSYKTAAGFLCVHPKSIPRLVKNGKIDRIGEGQHKKITTESLRRYAGVTRKDNDG